NSHRHAVVILETLEFDRFLYQKLTDIFVENTRQNPGYAFQPAPFGFLHRSYDRSRSLHYRDYIQSCLDIRQFLWHIIPANPKRPEYINSMIMFGIQKIESDIREGLLSRSRILLLVPVVLIILAALAFFPSLSNDFQRQWDDQWMLLEHHIILHPSLENIWYYFTHFDRGQYYPLNQLYYLGIHSLFGFDPAAFHAGSLIMHLINSILVFILIRQIGRQIVEPEHHFRLHWMAGLVALIFAIHPLQVESVAWISASKILLYATFTLSGLITYVIYIKSRKVVFLILTILAYILSFMCKEQAIILPLNIILLDWLFHTFGYREFSKRVLWEKIPF